MNPTSNDFTVEAERVRQLYLQRKSIAVSARASNTNENPSASIKTESPTPVAKSPRQSVPQVGTERLPQPVLSDITLQGAKKEKEFEMSAKVNVATNGNTSEVKTSVQQKERNVAIATTRYPVRASVGSSSVYSSTANNPVAPQTNGNVSNTQVRTVTTVQQQQVQPVQTRAIPMVFKSTSGSTLPPPLVTPPTYYSNMNGRPEAPVRVSSRPSTVETFLPPPAEFATTTTTSDAESAFAPEQYATATLRSVPSQRLSNSIVFRAKSTIASGLPNASPTMQSFQTKSIENWSTVDVCDWLESVNYEEYKVNFTEHKITGQMLVRAGTNELTSYGVYNLLHRIKLEREIRQCANKK